MSYCHRHTAMLMISLLKINYVLSPTKYILIVVKQIKTLNLNSVKYSRMFILKMSAFGEIQFVVNGKREKVHQIERVSFLQSSGPGSSSTPSSSSASGEAKVWGPQREVEVKRVEGKSLGLSIVGGKVDGVNSGIFVKNVLPDSPAGATGQLFTGDRILQVGNVTLTSSEQKVAVEAIKNSGDPIRLVVQSLQPSSSKVLPEHQLQ